MSRAMTVAWGSFETGIVVLAARLAPLSDAPETVLNVVATLGTMVVLRFGAHQPNLGAGPGARIRQRGWRHQGARCQDQTGRQRDVRGTPVGLLGLMAVRPATASKRSCGTSWVTPSSTSRRTGLGRQARRCAGPVTWNDPEILPFASVNRLAQPPSTTQRTTN
jgi:hypothetical protein